MKNFFILVKNYFKCLMGSLLPKKIRNTKNKVAVSLLFLGIGAFAALMIWQGCTMYYAFYRIGIEGVPDLGVTSIPNMELLAVQQGIMMLLMFCILTSAMRINAGAKDKDVDLLLSMPIKRSTIVLAKSFSKYLFNLVVSIIILLPYAIMDMVYKGFNFGMLGAVLLVILLFPLLIVGISHLLDYLTSRLFSRVKGGSIYKSLFIVVVLFLFLWGYMSVTNILNDAALASLNVLDTINAVAPLAWFVKFIFLGEWINLVWIFLLCLIPFIAGFWLFVKTFDAPTLMRVNKGPVNYDKGGHSAVFALSKKEISNYLNTPIWIINTIVGPIILIIATIAIAVGGTDSLSSMGFALPGNMVFGTILLIFIFSIGMTLVSCCSISLEGKNFWILKQAPLKFKDVMVAKSSVNLLMTVPLTIICSFILLFAMPLTIWQWALLIGLGVVYAFIMAFGGLFINLLFPKMKWESESSVVKRGMSLLINMMFTFVILAIVVGIYFVFANLAIEWIAFIVFGFFAAVLATIFALLFTVGKKLYNNLEA